MARPEPSVDGRRVRRDRNREAVLAATMACLAEGDGFFGLQEIADRSGVSLRSVHRYFEDSEELTLAAVRAFTARHLDQIRFEPPPSDAPLTVRVDAWIEYRIAGHRETGLAAVAAIARANRSLRVADAMEANRWRLVRVLDRLFAPELDRLEEPERSATLAMAHSITLTESWDNLVRRHGFDDDDLRATWRHQLVTLLRVTD